MKSAFTLYLALGALTCMAQTCNTPDGATASGSPVSALANFSVDDGSITVSLFNQQSDPRSAGQLLNAVAFTLASGDTVGTLTSDSADLRSEAKGGAYTDLGFGSSGWALADNFEGGMQLCVLCKALGTSGPSHLLIGDPAVSGEYSSANASIAGNHPHNPFTTNGTTFVISVPGLMANTPVVSAVFSFGTAGGGADSVTGSCAGEER